MKSDVVLEKYPWPKRVLTIEEQRKLNEPLIRQMQSMPQLNTPIREVTAEEIQDSIAQGIENDLTLVEKAFPGFREARKREQEAENGYDGFLSTNLQYVDETANKKRTFRY